MAGEPANRPTPDSSPVPGEAEPRATEGPGGPDPADRPGEFERYALIAALTLVVLCLLVWDRWHSNTNGPPALPPDRELHVQIGGGEPPEPRGRSGVNALPRAQPQVAEDPPPAPRPSPPPRTYTVKDGDTLSEIASRELGSSARAKEIADLNGLADPSKITPGQVLRLPPERPVSPGDSR